VEAALPSLTHQVRLTPESHGKASFSMGAAVYPEHAANVGDLLVLADSALLISKESGRSCITWLDGGIIRDIQRRHVLESKLRTALQARGITPHYQPEVDMRTGRITGFEALARWHDAELGDISPSEFIPIAEEHGLIDQVTEVLLEKLIADLPSIRAVFPEAAVAFNASAGLLSDQKLARFLQSHLGSARSDFSGLILEVTETDLMHSIEGATLQLEAIIAMGVQIAIDDFGKEYSSLARLAHLPIRKLKIDQSFVDALNDEDNIKVVSSIMALTRTLALDVTAEGVEEEFQCNMLMAMGCWKGQGFLFARPMPLAELLVLPSHLSIQPADDGIAEDKKNPQVVEN
jgi:EAL domain-containing protein (putative c-di-GMP-specific phosphodiesterase class I)